jgi:hypothetical protein
MQLSGNTDAKKKVFIVYLKLKFNWASGIPPIRRKVKSSQWQQEGVGE